MEEMLNFFNKIIFCFYSISKDFFHGFGLRRNEEITKIKKVFIISIFLLFSCKESDDKKYFKSGNLRERHFYSENDKKDSSVFYYDLDEPQKKQSIRWSKEFFYVTNYAPSGKKISEGKMNSDSIKIGKWNFYTGDTTKIFEYKNISGKEYLNQSWIKNSEGDTIRGNYVLLKKIKDTVSINELVSFRFYLEGPLISEDSELVFVLPTYGENFADDFSNEKEIEVDTILNLKYDSQNKHLKELPLNHMLIANFEFSSPGEKKVRGILKELYRPENDSTEMEERNIYFEKEIYVKDTLH